MYDRSVTEILKEKITLSAVVEKKVKIIHRGRSKVALCPFHNEKTPSFHIDDGRGFYHCFGCGAHGDIITFVMETEHIGFKDAVEKLAKDFGVELPAPKEITAETWEKMDAAKEIYKINEMACDFFEKNLFTKNGEECLNYLYKRGLNGEQIKKFRLGYAPNSFGDLINRLAALGAEEEYMLRSGVIAVNEKGNKYDKFRNRAMIPVMDKSGRVMAFTGRVLDKETMPKYMNSPETDIYHKGHVLFNYNFARNSIFERKKAILVEGNFDAISLYVNGVENVVAPMGTAATVEQFLELWRITEEIVVCFDGDLAGQKASLRAAETALPIIGPKRVLKFAFLPEGIDPDDFVRKHGGKKFEEYINDRNSSCSLSELIFQSKAKELSINLKNNFITPEDKGRLLTALNAVTGEIVDQATAKNFFFFFRGELAKMSKFGDKRRIVNYKNITKITPAQTMPSPLNSEWIRENILGIERDIFSLVAGDLNLINSLFVEYNVDFFSVNFHSPDADLVKNVFFDICENDRTDDREYLYQSLEKNNLSYYITGSSIKFKNNFSDPGKKIKYLYSLILEKNIAQLKLELREPETDGGEGREKKSIGLELERLQGEMAKLEEEF
ncbi:MAG: DNA primase [Rickettsiales bacterium]|jgi:DNA primase|nr:DNA primase [Rickettsiales bacterium]